MTTREYVKTFGVVIKQNDVGDADRSLTLLTEECGKIHIWVNGARRTRSRHLASSQLFCASNFVLYKGTNIYRINTSEIVEPFFNLRMDLDKLNFGFYLTELTNDGVQEGYDEKNKEILRLLLNSLHFISNTNKNPELVVHIFEIRFLSLIGFAPLLHEDSAEVGYGLIPLSQSAVKAVSHIVMSPLEKLFNFDVSDEVFAELRDFCGKYVGSQMGKEYITTPTGIW